MSPKVQVRGRWPRRCSALFSAALPSKFLLLGRRGHAPGGSEPRANCWIPTHGANLDFCASSESRCLSLLGGCNVPRLLKTAWVVGGDTSKNGLSAHGCPVQGMCQKRCWLASHCHEQHFLASARVKPRCRLRVNHHNIHMAELRGKEAEFPQGRQRKPQPRAPWGCRGRRS